jgi:hypothetical protein
MTTANDPWALDSSPHPGNQAANARAYRYDPQLDPIADLLEQGPQAYAHVPAKLVDLASIHKDFRDQYRAAVAAGSVPDDRRHTPTKEI